MPEPWVKYAAQPAPPPSGDGPWNNYGTSGQEAQNKEKQAYDNAPQANPGFMGPLQDLYDDAETAPPKNDTPMGVHGQGLNMLGSMARGVGDLLYPVVHPVKTAMALPKAITGPHGGGMVDTMLTNFVHDAKENPQEALPRFVGQMAGGELASGAGEAARAAGAPLVRVGMGAVNDALGARGPKPFQWGHDPARGAIDEGIVPAMSKHSVSMKLAPEAEGGGGVMDRVGGRIANAVKFSPNNVLLKFIQNSVDSPLNSASAVERGPGVGGVTPEQISTVRGKMMAKAPNASSPIYGSNAGTPFQPSEVVNALGNMGAPRLMPPEIDTPLHSGPDVEAVPSRPVTIHSPERFAARRLTAPAVDTPLNDNPFVASHPTNGVFDAPITNSRVAEPLTTPEGNPNHGFSSETPQRADPIWNGGVLRRAFDGGTASGMGPGESFGQISGERGGPGQPLGVLRQRMSFPESTDPSPFLNLRHDTATPSDLWATIRNVDEKTRFNKALPEVEGLNELQQNIRGGLANNLKQAVPEIVPHMQTYGDLAGARDALNRTMHSGKSLAKVLDAAKFPIETTGGVGLVKTGRALQKINPDLLRMMAAPGMTKEKQ